MTLCVVRREYAEKHPDLVHSFLDAYRASIEWTVANPADAGPLVERSGLSLKSDLATRAIPYCNFTFIDAKQGRASIEKLLGVFLEFSPEAIG